MPPYYGVNPIYEPIGNDPRVQAAIDQANEAIQNAELNEEELPPEEIEYPVKEILARCIDANGKVQFLVSWFGPEYTWKDNRWQEPDTLVSCEDKVYSFMYSVDNDRPKVYAIPGFIRDGDRVSVMCPACSKHQYLTVRPHNRLPSLHNYLRHLVKKHPVLVAEQPLGTKVIVGDKMKGSFSKAMREEAAEKTVAWFTKERHDLY